MKSLTPVETLEPGAKFYPGNPEERTVHHVEVIHPKPLDCYLYDDFRGAGPDYLRVWFHQSWGSGNGVLSYKDYPRGAHVYAGEGL